MITKRSRQLYLNRKRRIRKKLQGTAERPRLTVFRSARHIYVQAIDDEADGNRYLIKLEPGVYQHSVNLPEFMDLEGSGEGVTAGVALGAGVGTAVTAGAAVRLPSVHIGIMGSPK